MLFSSTIFLFWFLPAVILINLLLRWNRSLQNIFLCFASLFFYAWGEPKFVFVMMASIVINWMLGLMADHLKKEGKDARPVIVATCVVNLSIIFVFKYLGFAVRNFNFITGQNVTVPDIALPIGISFFTFQALSYVIDVYRGRGEAQKNVLNVGLYISFFPQLIAGPIVRYETIADQIRNRKENFGDFADGIARFITGLGKKIIIANNMALIADKAFELLPGRTWFGAENGLSLVMAWIGAIAYTFQIYYDFSGYSDMAIGLGKMFGFHFDENFNYPYISGTITEFWRRWHISLSSWFRDYVYIPLGGSKVSSASRHIFNLFVVWLLTGIWHGANWTLIAWGLIYFVLLVIEKETPLGRRTDSRVLGALRHLYVVLAFVLLWVIFRADSLTEALLYIRHMFIPAGAVLDDPALFYMSQYWVFFICAAVFSTPVIKALTGRLDSKLSGKSTREKLWRGIYETAYAMILLAIFAVSVSYMVMGSYNPFIYFNF